MKLFTAHFKISSLVIIVWFVAIFLVGVNKISAQSLSPCVSVFIHYGEIDYANDYNYDRVVNLLDCVSYLFSSGTGTSTNIQKSNQLLLELASLSTPDLGEMRQIASTRGTLLKEMIQENPGQAYDLFFTPEQLVVFPDDPELQSLLESPISEQGKLVVTILEDFTQGAGQTISKFTPTASSTGSTLETALSSQPTSYLLYAAKPIGSSQALVDLSGMKIDDLIAIGKNPDQGQVRQILASPVPPANRKVLLMPVTFLDSDTQLYTPAEMQAMLAETGNWLAESSYQINFLEPATVTEWTELNMNHPGADCGEPSVYESISTQAMEANNQAIDFNDYLLGIIVVAMSRPPDCGLGGIADYGIVDVQTPDGTFSASQTWWFLNVEEEDRNQAVVTHEIGHNYNLGHVKSISDCENPSVPEFPPDNCVNYDHAAYDLMSPSIEYPVLWQPSAPMKLFQNWLSGVNFTAESGVHTIKAIELNPENDNNKLRGINILFGDEYRIFAFYRGALGFDNTDQVPPQFTLYKGLDIYLFSLIPIDDDTSLFSIDTSNSPGLNYPHLLPGQSFSIDNQTITTCAVDFDQALVAVNDTCPYIDPIDPLMVFTSDRTGDEEIFISDISGGNQQNLTNNPSAQDNYPDISPDGTKVVYTSDRDYGDDNLYLLDLITGTTQILTSDPPRQFQPSFNSAGDSIVYVSDQDGDWDIYIMDLNTFFITQLVNDPAKDQAPRFSPDKQKIVFISDRDGLGNQVYQVNWDGSQLELLSSGGPLSEFISAGYHFTDPNQLVFSTNSPPPLELPPYNYNLIFYPNLILVNTGPEDDYGFRYTPDGQYLLFTKEFDSGGKQIYKMSGIESAIYNGEAITSLGNNYQVDISGDTEISQEAYQIIYSSKPAGAANYDLYTMNPDGSNIQFLVDFGDDDRVTDVSPDGSKMVFTYGPSSNMDIYIANSDGTGGMSNLTEAFGSGYYTHPSFNPQGNKIIFNRRPSSVSFNGDIFLMDVDGSNKTTILDDAYGNFEPKYLSSNAFIFKSDRLNGLGEEQDLFTMTVGDPASISLLYNSPTHVVNYDISPANDKVAITETQLSKFELNIIPIDASSVLQLYYPTYYSVSFAPDGKVLFTPDSGLGTDIYVIDQDGSNLTNLTNNQQNNYGAVARVFPAVPTITPTATPTPTPTSIPTSTLTSTPSPIRTITPTLWPTFTPKPTATPMPESCENSCLKLDYSYALCVADSACPYGTIRNLFGSCINSPANSICCCGPIRNTVTPTKPPIY